MKLECPINILRIRYCNGNDMLTAFFELPPTNCHWITNMIRAPSNMLMCYRYAINVLLIFHQWTIPEMRPNYYSINVLLKCYRDSAKVSPCVINTLPICCRCSTNALSRCNVRFINWLSTCYQWAARYHILCYNLRMLQICYRHAANPLLIRSE